MAKYVDNNITFSFKVISINSQIRVEAVPLE